MCRLCPVILGQIFFVLFDHYTFPVKFLYGVNYWISLGNEETKKSYEQILHPGQAKRIIEDIFENGIAFRLEFSVK